MGLIENKKLIQEKCKKENDTQGIVLYLKEGYFLTHLKNNVYIGKYYKKDSFSSKINIMDFNVVYKFKEGDMEIFSTSFKNFCDNLH